MLMMPWVLGVREWSSVLAWRMENVRSWKEGKKESHERERKERSVVLKEVIRFFFEWNGAFDSLIALPWILMGERDW